MDVIGAAGNGRAEITGGNVPPPDVVEMFEQRAVEGFHRFGIGEVDGFIPEPVHADERSKLRRSFDQRFKIIRQPMRVPRMQVRFFLFHNAKLVIERHVVKVAADEP